MTPSRAVSFDFSRFDLRAAAVGLSNEMAADDDEGQVVTLRGCPKYVKVVFSDFQLEALRDGCAVGTGVGWSAALHYGLSCLFEEPEVGDWVTTIARAKGEAGELPLATRVRLHRVIETPDFTMADPVGAGKEGLSFRCSRDVKRQLYETLRVVYLPGRTSTLALPSIAMGLANQPGVGREASEHLEAAFGKLVETFAEAERDLRAVMKGFVDG